MTSLKDQPFALLGVNVNSYDAKKLREVTDKEELNWRSFTGQGDFAAKWNASTPSYYVVDHKGVIRYKWIGYPGEKVLDAALSKLIEETKRSVKSGEK